MTKNAIVDDINKQLKDNYGLNNKGNANFRVVFSDDQRESRRGIYQEYAGKIFLREFIGVKEVPKYSWIKGKWILERWAGPELTYHEDIVSALDGDYVCIYIFQDIKFNYLPPLWKVAQIVVKASLNPRRNAGALEEDLKVEQKKEESEVDKIFNEIKNNYEKTATERESMSSGYVKDFVKEKK